MRNINGPLKVGIGGGIGTGKTSLTEALCRNLSKKVSMAVISYDIYTTEDAEYLMKAQVLPMERIKGVETGGCPHTAIREDCSINLLAVDEMKKKFPDLELILIESGGDNLAATFSPELVDLTLYMIDVAQGADIPRKKAPAIIHGPINFSRIPLNNIWNGHKEADSLLRDRLEEQLNRKYPHLRTIYG